jgi:hypothetical protein
MDKTLNQIKRDLNEIATTHKQINNFFFGGFLDAISQDAVQYPLMNCTIQPGTFGDNFVNVNVMITVCDKYNESNYDQIDEVHSDMMSILRDIYVTFKQERFEEYLDIDNEPSTDPFLNKGHDITAGWSMVLNLKIYDSNDWCSIPSDGFDYGND